MHKQYTRGFTIVELLIVIVVIAILAVIVIVAYNGVTKRAAESSLQAELKQIAKKLEADKQTGGDESYPPGGSGNTPPSSLRAGVNTTLQYTATGSGASSTYCVTASQGKTSYFISNNSTSPKVGACQGHNDASSTSVAFTLVWNFDEGSTTASSSNSNVTGGSITKSSGISNSSRVDYSNVGTVPTYEMQPANNTETLSKALTNQSYYTFPISTQATNWKIDSVELKGHRTGSSGPRGISLTLDNDTSMASANERVFNSAIPMPTHTFGGFNGLSGNRGLRIYVYSDFGLAGIRVDDITVTGTYQE